LERKEEEIEVEEKTSREGKQRGRWEEKRKQRKKECALQYNYNRMMRI
jgi:hypothetical protein